MAIEIHKGVIAIKAPSESAWRKWLIENHQQTSGVWLIIFKKDSKVDSINYDTAVDTALCFGWIDSKPNKRSADSFYQYFSKRNPKSNWSKVNKDKVSRLINQNKMHSSGLKMVELAKETGTWDALNEVDDLIIPEDLKIAFRDRPNSEVNFQAFPPSVRRGILEWIFNAKRPETRKKRVMETAELAKDNIRANQFR